jgi:hypothetical protein
VEHIPIARPAPVQLKPKFDADGIPIIQSGIKRSELNAEQQRQLNQVIVESQPAADRAAGEGAGWEPRKFEIATGELADPMDVDVSAPAADGSAGEWVYDTYVRNILDRSTAPGADAARLVIKEEDTEWVANYFYDETDDSDPDRVETDDEDSNAEDYYGADYPEEESEDDDDDDDADDEDKESENDEDYGHGRRRDRDEQYLADYDDAFQAMRLQ